MNYKIGKAQTELQGEQRMSYKVNKSRKNYNMDTAQTELQEEQKLRMSYKESELQDEL